MGGIAGIKGKSPSTYDTRPASSASAVSDASVLTFQPNGTAKGTQFTDWNALYAAFLLTTGPVLIAFDITSEPSGIAALPLGTYDMQGRATWTDTGLESGAGGVQVAIPDGGIVQNLRGLHGDIQLNTASTAVSPLQYTSTLYAASFAARDGAAFLQRGSVPVFAVDAGQTLFLTVSENVNVNSFNSFAELVGLTSTSTLVFEAYKGFNFFNASERLFSGPIGSIVNFIIDASWNGYPPGPNFSGTTSTTQIDKGIVAVYASDNGTTDVAVVAGNVTLTFVKGVHVTAGQNVIVHASAYYTATAGIPGPGRIITSVSSSSGGPFLLQDQVGESSVVAEEHVTTRSFQITGLPAGDYKFVLEGQVAGSLTGATVPGAPPGSGLTPGARLIVEVVSV